MSERERPHAGVAGSDGRPSGLPGGWTGWLLARLHARRSEPARLELLERIALAPRQALALIQAEGRRFLVVTSAEGAPAFYPLEGDVQAAGGNGCGAPARATRRTGIRPARISW